MFYSSHFHHVSTNVLLFFFSLLSQLHFLTQERTIACSGEREQMSAAVAQRLQKEPSSRFLGKLKQRSHSIQFNPSG